MKIYKFQMIIRAYFITVYSVNGYCNDSIPFEIVHGPYLQNVTETGATILFMTNKPAVPCVIIELGSDEHGLIQNSHDGLIDAGSLLHKIRVSGLMPGKQYQYRIFTREIARFDPCEVILEEPGFVKIKPE